MSNNDNGSRAQGTLTALFVALGGTSYAAISIPANSVGNKQLKSNSVTSGKVRNGTLVKKDFRAGQLPKGETGATGPQGPTGPPGQDGANGTAGATNVTLVRREFALPPNQRGHGYANCPSGQRATGGGTGTAATPITDDRRRHGQPPGLGA